MQLTVEQVQKLDQGESVTIFVEGRKCVLIRSDVYSSQEEALLKDWHPHTMRRQLADLMAEDWYDPTMSVYDDE